MGPPAYRERGRISKRGISSPAKTRDFLPGGDSGASLGE